MRGARSSAERWRGGTTSRLRCGHPGRADRLRGGAGISGAAALEVYRRGYWHRLVDAVLELYPRTARVLGGRAAATHARDFVRARPPQALTLERVAVDFGGWLRDEQLPATTAALALLEAAVLRSLIAPPRAGPPLTPDALRDPAVYGQRVRLVPDAVLVSSTPEAWALFEGTSLATPLVAEPHAVELAGRPVPTAGPALFFRPAGVVLPLHLDDGTPRLARALDGTMILAEALERAELTASLSQATAALGTLTHHQLLEIVDR